VPERDPEPGLGQLGERRDERQVEEGTALDPGRGGRAVEVPDRLGLPGGVAREPDPGVAVPPLVLGDASDQVADELAVADGGRSARRLLSPGAGDRRRGVLERGEQRLRGAVALVTLGQQPGRGLDVGVLESPDLQRD
jgi:hypothetical protein